MISDYFKIHANQIAVGLLIFVASLVVSSIACVFVILRLPPHYFHSNRFDFPAENPPTWRRVLGLVVKNVLGVGLVVLGLVMSLPGVPGQGLLTMFMGVVLLDLPGKRALERRIIATPAIFHACNRLRQRFGKEPFTLDTELPVTSKKTRAEWMDSSRNVHGRTK